ncbi:MAG TPA: flagellar hook protein FlgE [Terriglobales bacterium]|nr:flagellar hook protein FlgE [Terriglobales bacterium]
MPLFSIPLSGLTATSDALNVISNNLANLNTVGFKDQQANFQDLFYQTLGTTGAGDPVQQGAGTEVGSISTDFGNGDLQTTGVPTDVAITGNGFFVTQNATGATEFTRAGNFTVNAQGQLVTPEGQNVMGYAAVNGVINAGQGLTALQIGQGQISPPVATATMQQQTNLDASAAVGTQYSTPQTIYDSLGNSHVLTYTFTKTGTNTWGYQITLPAADTGGAGAPTVVNQGTLTFDTNGNLINPAANIAGIAINGLADGAANLNLTWDVFGPNNTSLLTQLAGQSTTTTTNQDGYASGTLQSYSIDANGVIQGQFSNGQVQAVGQIALASFANNQGLQLVGGNSYAPTLGSGQPVIGAPGAGGRGSLTGGALELSNVDISAEFTQLIVTQRGFEADARVVTTFDSVSNDTINLQATPGN